MTLTISDQQKLLMVQWFYNVFFKIRHSDHTLNLFRLEGSGREWWREGGGGALQAPPAFEHLQLSKNWKMSFKFSEFWWANLKCKVRFRKTVARRHNHIRTHKVRFSTWIYLSTAMMLRITRLLKTICIIWLLLLTSISSKRLVLEAFLLSVTFRMGIFPFPYTFVIVV